MIINSLLPVGMNPVSSLETSHKSTAIFTDWLRQTANTTNKQLIAADEALQQLAFGKTASLHQTMLIMEQAKLSFQFLEQIRNRLMNAYQDILKEQI